MKLTRICGAGFRAFDDPFGVDLPERGLVQVCAINKTTGGSSGAGKSTLFLVPSYVLGNGPPATKLVSWGGRPLQASISIEESGDKISVLRGKGMKLIVNGEEIEGNTKVLEEELWSRIKLPQEVIATLSFRKQKQESVFLSMSDEKKKSFLALAVPEITVAESKIKTGIKRVKELNNQLVVKETAYNTAKSALEIYGETQPTDELESDLAQLKEQTLGLEKLSRELKRDYDKVRIEREEGIRKLTKQYDQEHEQLKREIDTYFVPEPKKELEDYEIADTSYTNCVKIIEHLKEEDEVRRKSWQKKRDDGIGRNLVFREAQRNADILHSKLDQMRHEEKHLTGNTPVCPTCKRDWPSGSEFQLNILRHNIQQVINQIATSKAVLAEGMMDWDVPWEPNPQIAQGERAREELSKRLTEASAKLVAARVKLRVNVDIKIKELKDLKQTWENTIALYKYSELQAIDTKLRESLAEVGRTKQVLDLKQSALSGRQGFNQRRAILEQSFLQNEKEYQEIAQQYAKESDTLEAVKTFVGKSFDELLIEVSDATNAILANVPNVGNCSISFRSEVLNKDGEVSRNAISPVLSIGGHEVGLGPIDGASGGMLSSIHLATDIGVLLVFERRLNNKLGWLIFDEPFEGLDAPCREACLEILRQQAANRLILFVDHMTEIGGLADRTITIIHERGKSWVKSN